MSTTPSARGPRGLRPPRPGPNGTIIIYRQCWERAPSLKVETSELGFWLRVNPYLKQLREYLPAWILEYRLDEVERAVSQLLLPSIYPDVSNEELTRAFSQVRGQLDNTECKLSWHISTILSGDKSGYDVNKLRCALDMLKAGMDTPTTWRALRGIDDGKVRSPDYRCDVDILALCRSPEAPAPSPTTSTPPFAPTLPDTETEPHAIRWHKFLIRWGILDTTASTPPPPVSPPTPTPSLPSLETHWLEFVDRWYHIFDATASTPPPVFSTLSTPPPAVSTLSMPPPAVSVPSPEVSWETWPEFVNRQKRLFDASRQERLLDWTASTPSPAVSTPPPTVSVKNNG